ncbi:MAG: L-seryl-tRNA(Sec) selenium transferase [Thermoleophilaceae bacterium]
MRALPSVEEVAAELRRGRAAEHSPAVTAARQAVDARRAELVEGAPPARSSNGDTDQRAAERDLVVRAAAERADAAARPSLRRVINATGVIVHTNLGRAPLARAAIEQVVAAAEGYSNLEYDLEDGRRGSRQAHVEHLLRELTGAEAALAVNNCAAAALLACAALAAGREVVVSRGQLVEIGGSFRVPEVIEQSGARLREVGTTNRTRVADYERALGPDTGAIMRAHPSNFRTVGFVEETPIEDLAALGARTGVPVIDDAGSGALAEGIPEMADEPPVRRSVNAGCAVTCFSGDKLLGGPQAGLMVGTAAAIERCRTHPLARAVRIDKLSLAALEATLRLYRDPEAARREVPVLAMLIAAEPDLAARAERMRARLAEAGVDATVIRAAGRAGGGALPLVELEGPVCVVEPGPLGVDALAARLRAEDPPVIARARGGKLLLDPRTLRDDGEADATGESVTRALGNAYWGPDGPAYDDPAMGSGSSRSTRGPTE